jgi:hypothetical protein
MNLEDLVRAALAEEARTESGEIGAYDRFLRRRRRSALAVAASTGLAVALVLAVAIGGAMVVRGGNGDRIAGPLKPAPTTAATPTPTRPQGAVETSLPAPPPPVPVSAAGVVRRERQGFELTLPKGWGVDQPTTQHYYQLGQPWLVISPGGRTFPPDDNRRMTIFTAIVEPREYPGRAAGDPAPLLGGQSFSPLSGHRSSGRRADGRAFAVGDDGSLVHYAIAWPYRCASGVPCPEAAPWRAIRLEVEGTDGQEGRKLRALVGQLIESFRPITNALAPTGTPPVAEEPWLFADEPKVVGRGGQGDYAWEKLARKGSGQDYWIETRHQSGDLWYGGSYEKPARADQQAMIHCAPSRERATAMAVEGYGSKAVAKVVLEVEGQPPVEVATFRNKKFPFAFWVVAPLPPDARPQSFTSFDAAGRRIAKGTSFSGFEDCNP